MKFKFNEFNLNSAIFELFYVHFDLGLTYCFRKFDLFIARNGKIFFVFVVAV